MPAGLKYDLNPLEVERELWNQATTYRLAGGVNLNDDALTADVKLAPLTPLAVDFSTRTAKVCKNVKVVEAATATDTSIKVQKGSFAYVGAIFGTGSAGATVQSIDKSNAAFDTITFAATLGVALTVNQVLFEASAAGGTTVKNKCNYLNYAWTKVENGATLTLVGQAFEIQESKLYAPISQKDKDTLGARFMFV
jgi:hypothetical protein